MYCLDFIVLIIKVCKLTHTKIFKICHSSINTVLHQAITIELGIISVIFNYAKTCSLTNTCIVNTRSGGYCLDWFRPKPREFVLIPHRQPYFKAKKNMISNGFLSVSLHLVGKRFFIRKIFTYRE
jgi:hypothetical protein